MTEVGPADRSRLLRSKRDEFNSIVTSRKRKLRQLFAVATEGDALPTNDFANPDATPATTDEIQFLRGCDVLQGRKLEEGHIPTRPQLRYDALKNSLDASGLFAPDVAPPPSKQDAAAEPQAKTVPTPSQQQPIVAPSDAKAAVSSPQPPASLVAPSVASAKAPTPPAPATPNRSDALNPPPAPAPVPSPAPAPVPSPSPAVVPIKNPLHASRQDVGEPADVDVVEKPVQSPARDESSAISKQAEPRPADAPQAAVSQPTTQPPAAQPSAQVEAKKAEESAPLSVKLPPDTARAVDVLSSPGSTTQTAATPVHDESTDTSPDNEGPHYAERAEASDETEAAEKAEEGPKAPEAANPTDGDRVPDGPEAQLLQESMAMDSTPSAPVVEPSPKAPTPPPASEAPAAQKSEVKTSEPAAPKPPTPTPAQDAPVAVVEPSAAPAAKEVPDSQEESSSADRMDVDQPNSNQAEEKISAQEDVVPEPTPAERQPSEVHAQAPSETPQDPERAVTRTASGAMRQKSVSEILGESKPKDAETASATKVPPSQLTPVTSTPQSPAARSRTFANKKKDKAKNKPSAVVFGKQTKRSTEKSMVPQQRQSFLPTDDYFTPLFVQGFTQTSKWMKPIEVVLNQSHKTVSTPDAYVAIQDNQACRVLRRVYHLQQHDKWSLRQPKRCPEPVRQETHWDVLLHEMKWMRTDFREERKWKTAVARNLANACAEWVASTEEERKELQVAAYIPPKPQAADAEADTSMAEGSLDAVDAQPTPELVSSGDLDSPEHVDELREEILETVAPSAIFALEDDDVVFELRSSPTADQLLQELPMYGTPLKVPQSNLFGPEFDPDAHWRRPALPLSKYVEGEMKLSTEGPPRKRSRFQYEEEEDDEDEKVVVGGSQPAKRMKLQPENTDVALFNPEMKPIRDRLHAGHQFRPPAEYQMPMQSFYECRSPSQWTLAEDEELRGLVREYSYNWSLISSLLTSRPLFASGAERRTPWECFERWIQLEGLPSDMQKTQYFKAYQNRIDAANRVIMQQNQLAQQQQQQQQQHQGAGATTPATPIARRRPSTPLRVERRRNQKHLTLIDAMRKLAKKREAAAAKQQHASQVASARKPTEPTQPRGQIKTPRDYSLMRWERDQQLAEKVAQFHQRQESQRRQMAMQARAQGQVAAAQMANTPGAGQIQPNGAAQVNGNMARPNMPNQLAVPGQGRGRMPMQAPTANMGAAVPAQMAALVPPMPMNGVPQAQMQAALQAQTQVQAQAQHRMPMANPQPDPQLLLQARRISEQQRHAVQMQQQAQQHAHQQQPQQGQQAQAPQGQQGQQGQQMHQGTPASQSHSPPNMRPAVNGINGTNGVNGVNGVNQNFVANAQVMMASFNAAAAANGMSTPPAGGLHMPNGTSGSPRPQMPTQIQQQISLLEAQYKTKHPNMTSEQARQAATDYMTRYMIQQRTNAMNQSAMNAAAGGGGASSPGMPNGIAASTSPHQYAALLRQQQQQQAAQAAAAQQNGQHQNGQHQQAQQHRGQQQQAQHHAQQQQHAQQHQQHHQARATSQPQSTPTPQPQSTPRPQPTPRPQSTPRTQPTPQPTPQTQHQAQPQSQQQHTPQQQQQHPQQPQQAQQAHKAQQAQKAQTPQVQQAPQGQPAQQAQQGQQAQQVPQTQQAQQTQKVQQPQPQAQPQAQQQAQQQRQSSGSATPSATPS